MLRQPLKQVVDEGSDFGRNIFSITEAGKEVQRLTTELQLALVPFSCGFEHQGHQPPFLYMAACHEGADPGDTTTGHSELRHRIDVGANGRDSQRWIHAPAVENEWPTHEAAVTLAPVHKAGVRQQILGHLGVTVLPQILRRRAQHARHGGQRSHRHAALMLCGGHGNISVTANIAPRLMSELCKAALAGDTRRAMEIQRKLMPVHKNLFVEANPIPVKWAATRLGLCGPTLRLPMTPLSQHLEATVEAALRDAGLL